MGLSWEQPVANVLDERKRAIAARRNPILQLVRKLTTFDSLSSVVNRVEHTTVGDFDGTSLIVESNGSWAEQRADSMPPNVLIYALRGLEQISVTYAEQQGVNETQ